MNEDVKVDGSEDEASELPYIKFTLVDGGWTMDSNLQQGQAKWSVCELAAVFMAELKPKG